jgi:hypothetical protein
MWARRPGHAGWRARAGELPDTAEEPDIPARSSAPVQPAS